MSRHRVQGRSCARRLPWNAVYIACYEQSKRFAAGWLAPSDDNLQAGATDRDQTQAGTAMALPGWAIASCAAGSATAAVVVTHPVDVVKTRLQVTLPVSLPVAIRPPLVLTLRLLGCQHITNVRGCAGAVGDTGGCGHNGLAVGARVVQDAG